MAKRKDNLERISPPIMGSPNEIPAVQETATLVFPAEENVPDSAAPVATAPPESGAVEEVQPAEKKLVKYRVELKCPTPLRNKILEVMAEAPSEAWNKFMAHNGISGSSHEKDIREIKE